MADEAALALLDRIYANENALIDTAGRFAHHVPATIPAEDLRALAERRLTPNSFRDVEHDEAVTTLRRLAAAADERTAADAFVASLGPARLLRWRALLPAVALGTAMPAHPFPADAGARICDVCFLERTTTVDTTLAWWHRARHGSPLPGDVCHYILALEAAARPWPTPTPADVWTLHEILDVIRSLPPATRAGRAARALRERGLLGSRSPQAYQALVEDLAFLGILQTPDHPGMLTAFTTARRRDDRPGVRVEASAPLSFWSAAHGVTESLVDRLFGHLARPPERPHPPAQATPRRTSAVGKRAAPLPSALRGEARAGDVYAVQCREDAWILAFCHELQDRNGRRYGLVEYLDGLFPCPPTADDIDHRGFRGRPENRWQQWTSHLDKTPRVRRIARDVPTPPDDRPPPDRVSLGNAKDLRHLAGWCFPELA
ncbi:hypothetical protein [Actinoplanes sp. N902-109]|uniref:hypothetical protein n=1 Tax=Actinoplanes sp. (strain N902-109) TaxID=649831 RepID=UPI0003293CF4|nr:hypothetical protein [Actinoplanes sp. N902-109]AGL15584.1 hypothetical protein L083_2074 [Actinoplanes sp. N902-109]